MFGNGQRNWGQILILAAALILSFLECKNQDLTPSLSRDGHRDERRIIREHAASKGTNFPEQ